MIVMVGLGSPDSFLVFTVLWGHQDLIIYISLTIDGVDRGYVTSWGL